MKKEKRNYEAPSLTVVSFKAEKGYSASGQLTETNYDRTDYSYTNDSEHNQTWGTF